MSIIAIDPGPEESAYVMYTDGKSQRTGSFGKIPNAELLAEFAPWYCRGDELVIEQIASMGMSVGQEVFETCVWTGMFMREWEIVAGRTAHRIKRHEVKRHICHSVLAKDGNIRQAIIDRYGGQTKAIGGVRCPKCGGKGWTGREHAPCAEWLHPPGPLKDVTADVWQALALAITYAETKATVAA